MKPRCAPGSFHLWGSTDESPDFGFSFKDGRFVFFANSAACGDFVEDEEIDRLIEVVG